MCPVYPPEGELWRAVAVLPPPPLHSSAYPLRPPCTARARLTPGSWPRRCTCTGGRWTPWPRPSRPGPGQSWPTFSGGTAPGPPGTGRATRLPGGLGQTVCQIVNAVAMIPATPVTSNTCHQHGLCLLLRLLLRPVAK